MKLLGYASAMHGLRLLFLAFMAALLSACATMAPPADPAAVPSAPAGTAPVPAPAEPARGPTPGTTLARLEISSGTIDQVFHPDLSNYTASVGFLVTRLRLAAIAGDPAASVAIGDASGAHGAAEAELSLEPGGNRISIVVTAPDGLTRRAYELVIERRGLSELAQRAYVKASNADSNDLFGYSVAASGDTLAVGAYLEDSFATGMDGDQRDNSADGSGAVYVFVRSGDTWLQQAYIKASNTAGGHQFGRAVALSGDTLVVGAPFEDSGARGVDPPRSRERARDSGAAYVFTRSGGVWTQEAYIKASNAGAGHLFGSSVAVSGDRLAVGAYLEGSAATGVGADPSTGSAEHSGAVYVYRRAAGGWSEETYIKSVHARAGDRFGYSLDLAGDTLAVGAYMDGSGARGVDGDPHDRSAPGSGAVHVYVHDAGGWSHQAYIKASNTATNHLFGSSIALSGDTLAVGAHLEDGGGANNSGAVYVYTRGAGGWSQQAYLKGTPGGAGYRFGRSVALEGDTLAAGAYLEDARATGINPERMPGRSADSGAVYVFTRNGATWSQQAWIKASNARPGDMFGYSLALSGGLLAAGAPIEASAARGIDGDQADSGTPGSGAVYIFR